MKGTNPATLARVTISALSELVELETHVQALPGDPTQNHAAEITAKVRAGVAKAYNITRDGRYAGFFVTEVFGPDLVVLAMGGFEKLEIFQTMTATVESLARAAGCRGISFNTVRAGLIHKALSKGFQISTVTMRKTL